MTQSTYWHLHPLRIQDQSEQPPSTISLRRVLFGPLSVARMPNVDSEDSD